MKNKQAFTLVELIVVVTILAILSTIGFVSYSGYLAGVRDTNRIAQLKAIGDALHLYSTNKSLPTPDDKIDIKTNTKIISYQGYVGKDVIETVGYTAEGLDPKDNTYFSYYLTKDKKYFQLMGYLEEEQGLTFKIKLNNQTQAEIDYETRYPRVEGSKLGILTGTGGAPLQELITGEIDLVTQSTGITSILSNSETQTGTTLQGIASDANCKRLYEVGGKRISGVYKIDPNGDGAGFRVYCDMETDGGGWTYATMLADGTNANLFFTPNTDKITSIDSNISTKGQLSNIWVDDSNKDIFLQCFTNSLSGKLINYEIPTIIYEYRKSDINNLEKNNKEGSAFSSTNLEGKWNGNNFTLGLAYIGSSIPESVYIVENTSLDRVFSLPYGNRMRTQNIYYPKGAGYSLVDSLQVVLDSNNYCMTAIR